MAMAEETGRWLQHDRLAEVVDTYMDAAVWALQKFRHWIFGAKINLYSDHNPLTYLTDKAPKSAKLMRWQLAMAEQDMVFKFKSSQENAAADALTRLGPVC